MPGRGRPRKKRTQKTTQTSPRRARSTATSTSALLNPRRGVRNTVVNTIPAAIKSNTSLLPMTMLTKHRYVQMFSLNPGTNGRDSFTFSMNSLNNPCITTPVDAIIGAHQPLGYDNFVALYNNYKVLKSRLKVTAVSINATVAGGNSWITVQGHDNVSYTPVDISLIIERGLAKYKLCGLADGGTNKAILTFDYDYRKMFPGRALDDALTATPPNNPAEIYYCSVSQAAVIQGEDPAKITYLAEINYYVEWSSPIQIDRS